jgi:hypothetical protein
VEVAVPAAIVLWNLVGFARNAVLGYMIGWILGGGWLKN